MCRVNISIISRYVQLKPFFFFWEGQIDIVLAYLCQVVTTVTKLENIFSKSAKHCIIEILQSICYGPRVSLCGILGSLVKLHVGATHACGQLAQVMRPMWCIIIVLGVLSCSILTVLFIFLKYWAINNIAKSYLLGSFQGDIKVGHKQLTHRRVC